WAQVPLRSLNVRVDGLEHGNRWDAPPFIGWVGAPSTYAAMDLSRSLPKGSAMDPLKDLISVQPKQSLLEAASLLIGKRIHRIPLIERKVVPIGPPNVAP